MDNADLITLLEGLLGPASGNVPREPRPSSASMPLGMERAPRTTPRPTTSFDSGPHDLGPQPTLTGFLTAVTPVGLAIIEATELRVMRANDRFMHMLGLPLSPEEAAGYPISDLSPIFATEDVADACYSVVQTSVPSSAVFEGPVTMGGDVAYFRCTFSPLHQTTGGFSSLLLTLQDATEAIQNQLRASARATGALRRSGGPAHPYAARAESAMPGEYLRSWLIAALARGEPLGELLPSMTRAAMETLADICVVFLANEQGAPIVAAVAHRDIAMVAHLRAQYEQSPIQRGEGIVGQALLQGTSLLLDSVESRDFISEVPLPRQMARWANEISYAACVPLPSVEAPIGVLLAVALGRRDGVAEPPPERATLEEAAAILGLAARAERQASDLRQMRSQRDALLSLTSDGIVIFDQAGNPRMGNSIARQWLFAVDSLPASSPDFLPAIRRLFDVDGRPLARRVLPWMRALQGEEVGAREPECVFVEGDGGALEPLLLHAKPLRDAAGTITEAIVVIRSGVPADVDRQAADIEDQETTVLSPSMLHPSAGTQLGTCDLGELCAHVMRGRVSGGHQRVEVRIPKQTLLVALPPSNVERLLGELVGFASRMLPPNAPLHLQVWREGAHGERISSGPASPTLGPAGASGVEPRALIRISAPAGTPASDEPAPDIETIATHAATLGGAAWLVDDPETGREVYLALPLARS